MSNGYYWAKLYINANWVSLSKIFALTLINFIKKNVYTKETNFHQVKSLHKCKPSLMEQSFYININQVLLDRVFTLMPTKLYLKKCQYQYQSGLIEQSSISTLIRLYWAKFSY